MTFPLHDPSDRVAIGALDHGWQVRAFAPNDRRFVYCVPRRMFHLQLWHEGGQISVITPSRLTCERFELQLEGARYHFAAFGHVATFLRRAGYAPPDASEVARRIRSDVDDLVASLCPLPITTFRGGLA